MAMLVASNSAPLRLLITNKLATIIDVQPEALSAQANQYMVLTQVCLKESLTSSHLFNKTTHSRLDQTGSVLVQSSNFTSLIS